MTASEQLDQVIDCLETTTTTTTTTTTKINNNNLNDNESTTIIRKLTTINHNNNNNNNDNDNYELINKNAIINNFNNDCAITSPNNNNNNNNHHQMRILIFSESFYPYTSGIARRLIEIIKRLAKKGFKIHILTGMLSPHKWIDDNNEYGNILKENVTFGILKSKAFKNKIDCTLPFLYPQIGILTEIIKFKPNVIHVVEHTPAACLCIVIAKLLDIPIVCSSHTNIDSYIPLFINKYTMNLSLAVYRHVRANFLNMADCNLTVSSDFVQLLSQSGLKQNIFVWKTGVDSELFNPKYRSHETRLRMFNGHYSPDKILLVSIGRISPEKNFEFLLKIVENYSNIFLCIVGDGPYRDAIEPLFPKDRTYFMGFLTGEQLASAYASADFFIYASVSETFGQVYLEAMSSGIPIVAAEGQQMKEFFVNGQHGYTWKPGDVESAMNALNSAIENHEYISSNCRSNALNHSWDSSAEQIVEIYNKYKNHKQDNSRINILLRSVYYVIKWAYLMILTLVFMAPFVTSPTVSSSTNNNNNNENNNKNNFCLKNNDKKNSSSDSNIINRINTNGNANNDINNNNTSSCSSSSSSSSNKVTIKRNGSSNGSHLNKLSMSNKQQYDTHYHNNTNNNNNDHYCNQLTNYFYYYYDKLASKLCESNRICAFLATLSALLLSLIFTSIYCMLNGKFSTAGLFTIFN